MKVSYIRIVSLLFLAGALQLLVAVAASADDYGWMKPSEAGSGDAAEGVKLYATIKGGGFFPDRIARLDMNTGTGAEIGIGVKPVRFLAAELTAGYLETDSYDNNPYNYHLELSALPVMLTLKAIAPLKYVEPYLLGGMGFHYMMVKWGNSNLAGTAILKDDAVYSAFQYGGGVKLFGVLSVEGRKVQAYKDFADNKVYSGLQVYGSVDIGF